MNSSSTQPIRESAQNGPIHTYMLRKFSALSFYIDERRAILLGVKYQVSCVLILQGILLNKKWRQKRERKRQNGVVMIKRGWLSERKRRKDMRLEYLVDCYCCFAYKCFLILFVSLLANTLALSLSFLLAFSLHKACLFQVCFTLLNSLYLLSHFIYLHSHIYICPNSPSFHACNVTIIIIPTFCFTALLCLWYSQSKFHFF